MICPACANEMTAMAAGDITVDVCMGGCGGIWFDMLELRRLDETTEARGDALAKLVVDAPVKPDSSRKHGCPKCGDVVMMRHFYSPKRKVVVDACPECGGHFLDAGEFARIRTGNVSDADRDKMIEDMMETDFADELGTMERDRLNALEERSFMRRMFRFF